MLFNTGFGPGLYFGLGIDSTNMRYEDWWFLFVDLMSIPELGIESLEVYPNPSTENLIVNRSGRLRFFSMDGRLVHSANVTAGEAVQIGSLAQGTYNLRLTAHGKRIFQTTHSVIH